MKTKAAPAFFLAAALCLPPAATAATLFYDDFAAHTAGWSFDGFFTDASWQIGPAAASTGHGAGFADPAFDHTPSDDNGVAGVIIGGNAPTNVTTFARYLTSSAIDTAVTGSVILEFWRYLNSDYTPYMQNLVQVFDGSTWVSVFQSGGFPGIADSAWTHFQYDVTAYKNASFMVRFGYWVQSSGALAVSGWNLDDVAILAPDVTLIPEPETWALLLAGLLLIGVRARMGRGT